MVVCARDKRGAVLLRGRGVLGSGIADLTSGASTSGPDVKRMCAGIWVRIELIRASSCSVSFFEGEEIRESVLWGDVSDLLLLRILTGVEPASKSVMVSNLCRDLAGTGDDSIE